MTQTEGGSPGSAFVFWNGATLQQARTGRRYGNQHPPTKGNAKAGTALVEWEEFDHWCGPSEPDEEGEYIRTTRMTKMGRFEWP